MLSYGDSGKFAEVTSMFKKLYLYILVLLDTVLIVVLFDKIVEVFVVINPENKVNDYINATLVHEFIN